MLAATSCLAAPLLAQPLWAQSDLPLPSESPEISNPVEQTDPLLDRQGETAIYIGIVLLIIATAASVGILSRRIEHAILTALGLSLIPIAFFVFTRQ